MFSLYQNPNLLTSINSKMFPHYGPRGCVSAPYDQAVQLQAYAVALSRFGSTHPARGKWQVYPFGYLSR